MPQLRTVSQESLPDLLEQHRIWLATDGTRGQQANLQDADLHDAKLDHADLRSADLTRANLDGVSLRSALLDGGADIGCGP